MGGKAIKALQIYIELKRQGIRVHQITHERVKSELDRNFPEVDVSHVKDTPPQKLLRRSKPLAPSLNTI